MVAPARARLRQTARDEMSLLERRAARRDGQGRRRQDDARDRARAARGRARPAHDRRGGGRAARACPSCSACRRGGAGNRDRASRAACGASRSTPTGRCWNGCRRSAGAYPGSVLASSSTFQYFAAAAPGAKELVSMVKIWDLTQAQARGAGAATTWSCSTRRPPATRSACSTRRARSARSRASARSPGRPIACGKLLEDPTRCGYVAVAHATEMAITETLELQERLRRPARSRPRRGDRQRRAATALQRAGARAARAAPRRRRKRRGDDTRRAQIAVAAPAPRRRRSGARRSWPRTRSQTARASSTISSRACAGGSSLSSACPSSSPPSSTSAAIAGIAEHLRRKL